MGVNKVVCGTVAIMDISDSTVTEDTLNEGSIAYGANGERITGKMKAGAETAEHTWDQVSTAVKNFLDNVTYDPSDYSVSKIADYAPATADINNTYPIGQAIDTESGVLVRNGYEITVSGGSTILYNDIPNRFTEYVTINNGSVSNAGTLKPTGALRQIKCNTSNVRDLGGWACDGGTVKYGKLFRGGEFQTDDLDIFVNQLRIRHELNLRGKVEAESKPTNLRDHIGYTCPEQFVWYKITGYDEAWKAILRCVFDCVTTNRSVYFHCSAGADRTATVACILEAILGMSQSDIDKDYELSCFASGVATDNAARRRNEDEWKSLINQINALAGSTFRDKVINWVASLGFTADEINAYRTAMIDGTPDAISLNVASYSVTNSIGTVETDNAATTAVQYQPYEAELVAPYGYAIGNLKITMGGVDVTASVFKGHKTTLNRAVVKNLTNCSLDNARGIVIDGQGYVANLSANEGFTLEGGTITITMGGVDMSAYYSAGKIAIPNVTGDIVITATAVVSVNEYIPITWLVDKRCPYVVGSACTVSDLAGYTITEKMPAEQGKTYEVNFASKLPMSNIRFVGISDSDVVTEVVELAKGASEYTWTPTLATTTGFRLRSYTEQKDVLLTATVVRVS